MEAVRSSTISRTSPRLFSSFSRRPACRHCWTAAWQPARLKMKVMAGSRPSASSRSMTSGLDGVQIRLR